MWGFPPSDVSGDSRCTNLQGLAVGGAETVDTGRRSTRLDGERDRKVKEKRERWRGPALKRWPS
jgi:hypothetical protein